jgi:hypothetical protein
MERTERYPGAHVRRRELADELGAMWYVYRDGRWARPRPTGSPPLSPLTREPVVRLGDQGLDDLGASEAADARAYPKQEPVVPAHHEVAKAAEKVPSGPAFHADNAVCLLLSTRGATTPGRDESQPAPWGHLSPWDWALGGYPLEQPTDAWRYVALALPSVALTAVGVLAVGRRDVAAA